MSITQIFKGDSTGAVKAVLDLNKAIDATEEQAKLSVKEMKALDSAAKRVAENVNPQEKYNRKMAELAILVKQGKVEISDAEKQAHKYQQTLERAGKSGADAFGGPLLSKLGAMGAGIVSATGLVSALTSAFREADAAAKEAANSAFSSLGAQGELQQLTDDPRKLAEVNQFAKELVRRGIFSPSERAQAFETSFELESAGFSAADKEKFAAVGEGGLVKPSGLVGLGGFVRKAQRTFGLGEETTADVLDKLIQTAATAQASLVETARAFPEFGTQAKAFGLSLDEALAGFLAVEKRSPGSEEAATRFKNFLGQAEKGGLIINNDLTDTLDALEKRFAAGERDIDLIPEIRALAGLRALRTGRAEIGPSEAAMRDSAGLADERSGLLEQVDPLFRAGKLRQRAEGGLADTREQLFAEKQTLFDALTAQKRKVDEENLGGVFAALESLPGKLEDLLGLEESRISRAAQNFGGLYTPEQQEAAKDYMRRAAEGSERTATAVEDIKKRKPQPAGRQE